MFIYRPQQKISLIKSLIKSGKLILIKSDKHSS